MNNKLIKMSLTFSACLLLSMVVSLALANSRSPGDYYQDRALTNGAHSKTRDAASAGQVGRSTDVWGRIRAGFSLPDGDHPQVTAQRNWYAKNKGFLDRTFTRARPFLYHIMEEIDRRGMPSEIALLPVVESAFQPFAYSHGRAAGMWQFIPATGRRYGLKINWWYDGRRDITASTRAALDYLQALHKRFKGDWLLALAAYNSGEGTVSKAVKRNRRTKKPTDFWSLKLPKETRGYVPRLLAISSIVANPAKYNLNLQPIPEKPYFTTIDVGSQIDIALAAELADMTIEQIYHLNPAVNRWATDPNGPHRLLIPLEKSEAFQQRLVELTPKERVQWKRHRISDGETLSHIAKTYQTTTTVLRQVNDLNGSFIRAGHHLVIPVAQRSLDSYSLSADERLRKTLNTQRGTTKTVHNVSPGDTLWDLSRKYDVSMTKLASWNGMAKRDTLRVGQRLVVWTSNKNSHAKNAVYNLPHTKPQRIYYTVRKGDSLSRIAQRFNVSVKKIKNWNTKKLKNKRYIQPGQKLTLYIDITRTAENT